jgi:zinc transport system permease protein
MMLSSLTGVSSVLIGIYTSFVLNLPTGATIVMVNFLSFMIAFLSRHAIHISRH